jgi:hypothetical protein
MYTRQWVKAKVFSCDRNRALSSYIVIEKIE